MSKIAVTIPVSGEMVDTPEKREALDAHVGECVREAVDEWWAAELRRMDHEITKGRRPEVAYGVPGGLLQIERET